MRASIQRATALFSVWLLLPSFVLSQCAETQQNPYCDPSFVNLICCPAPSVCYWIDRQGNPGCCAPGQVCGVGGGGAITVQPTTYVATQGTQPTATTTLVGGVVGTVTSGVVGVFSTVTSGAVGVYSTVTSAVGGAFVTVSGVLVGSRAPKAGFDLSILVIPFILTFWTMAGAAGFYFR